jgi:L-ribulose-5-phosphate 3-epimerase
MKYAMMTYTFAHQLREKVDMVQVCQWARKFNLEGMDQVGLYGHPAHEIRTMADDHGLKIVCYTFGVDLNFPEARQREAGLDKIREGLEIAKVLGAPMIMLPLGGKAGLTREQSQRNFIEGLKPATRLATAAGIKISVEHFPDPIGPFVTSADVNKLTAEIPEMYVTFDSGNVMTGGEDPRDGFLNSKSRIIHAHFKDWTLSADGQSGMLGLDHRRYECALIGEGIIDYPALIKTMNEAGYDGYVNIEYTACKYSPEIAIGKALEYLRKAEESRSQ